MSLTIADHAVEDYLDDLRDALAGVPRMRRQELVAEIGAHIAEARRELDDPFDEVAVRTVLDRLGSPEEIAAEARGGEAPAPPAPPAPAVAEATWRAPAAIVLLLFGAFAGGVGWLVGVVLLWASPRWSTGDKLAGTLLVPGGLLGSLLTLDIVSGVVTSGCAAALSGADIYTSGAGPTCDDGGTSWLAVVAVVLVALLPVATAAFLAVRLRPNRA